MNKKYAIKLYCTVDMSETDKMRYDALDMANDHEVIAFWSGMVLMSGKVIGCGEPEERKMMYET